jgi:hypothetical protein
MIIVPHGAPVRPRAMSEARVENYVRGLQRAARPAFTGLSASEVLQVHWPQYADASRQNLEGFETRIANPLYMTALFAPAGLTDYLSSQIEAVTSAPLPPDQRPARLRELAIELER